MCVSNSEWVYRFLAKRGLYVYIKKNLQSNSTSFAFLWWISLPAKYFFFVMHWYLIQHNSFIFLLQHFRGRCLSEGQRLYLCTYLRIHPKHINFDLGWRWAQLLLLRNILGSRRAKSIVIYQKYEQKAILNKNDNFKQYSCILLFRIKRT